MQPIVYYSRWKRISSNSSDSVYISIDNGSTIAVLEGLSTLSLGSASWVNKNFKISDYLTPTSTMTFKIRAEDQGQDSNNEAGLDRFLILDSVNNNSVNEIANKVEVVVYPNPFTDRVVVQVLNQKPNSYSLKMFDVYGRLVRMLNSDVATNSFVIEREGMGSGMYFYQIIDSNITVSTGKICVE
jgi:hypothetical protein